LKVFAVNYPLLYFAERIGGEHMESIYPIPADIDPAYWVPYQALEEIQKADLILANGADYAKWMGKVSLPASKVVNTSEAMTGKYIKVEEGVTHSHGAEGEHVHYGYAFTTWLDFKMALAQAEAVKNAMVNRMPKQKDAFEKNFNALKADLESLDMQMSETAGNLPEIAIFASHPVYQYLARAYGLEIISEHWEPGENPTDDQWKEFRHNLDHHPANLMLWEGEPTDEVKSKLKELKVETVLFNPCSNKPESGDFLDVMKKNIERLNQYISEFC
jgi:zinc transport system substrate-binding protein